MEYLQQSFKVSFQYKVFFTEHLFDPSSNVFKSFVDEGADSKKILFIIDKSVAYAHPDLQKQIRHYISSKTNLTLIEEFVVITGGESAKNNSELFYTIVDAINKHGIDRHSYVAAIGGGSVLDLAGYAAAVSHRGIRHIRIPTTVLSQNDSGVGVKNGINYAGKKNFLGTFVPPVAVFNDFHFLTSLSDAEWRSGISEAIKVALIKDAEFFEWIEENASALSLREMNAMKYLIKRCAELHLQHIASGDPFESGSSRPLDFGHWSAHKLEQLTDFEVRHGEAVAMGMALDSAYSFLSGKLSKAELNRIMNTIQSVGLAITHPLFEISDENSPLLAGLNEFREHLGGRLTIMLLDAIGKGEEVHEMDTEVLEKASKWLTQQEQIIEH
jgi:3-dehydroquinate synthase